MPQHRTNNGTSIAADFLHRCFAPGESIALLLRRENPAGFFSESSSGACACASLSRLACARNSIGANIYVAANPATLWQRKRTKECIAAVRASVLDLDTMVRPSRFAPGFRCGSPAECNRLDFVRKYQVLWRVDGFISSIRKAP